MTLASEPGSALASAALSLVNARFRLHGRDPATGLDCLGVLAASLTAIGRTAPLPTTYTLRTREPSDLAAIAGSCGLVSASRPIRTGDVALVRIGATQLHLLITIGAQRYVHAHAGLRRVVAHDGPLVWPIAALWRLRDSKRD